MAAVRPFVAAGPLTVEFRAVVGGARRPPACMNGPTMSAARASAVFSSQYWQHLSCAIVESPAEIRCLDLKSPAELQLVARFPNGVAFGEENEIRWITRAGNPHAVMISDRGAKLEGAYRETALEPLPPTVSVVFLWGQQDQNRNRRLHEDRIPRLFRFGPRPDGEECLVADFIYPAGAPRPDHLHRLAIGMKGYELRVIVPHAGNREVDAPAELAKIQAVLIRVLLQFPDAWKAVLDGLEQLSAQPWQPLSKTELCPSQ